jgi:hypothetical protein
MDRYIYEEFIKKRGFGIIAFYDISRGLTFFDAGMEKEFNIITSNEAANLMNAMPSKLFPYIDKALKNTKMALFIDHVEKIIPAGDIASMTLEERISLVWICEWSVSQKISSVGSCIMMLSDNLADVSRELLKSSYRIEPIFVGLPDEAQRKEYIEYLLKDNGIKTEITADEFAKLSSGLSKKSIKDIKLKSEAEDIPISFEFIKEKKHSVLQKEYGMCWNSYIPNWTLKYWRHGKGKELPAQEHRPAYTEGRPQTSPHGHTAVRPFRHRQDAACKCTGKGQRL